MENIISLKKEILSQKIIQEIISGTRNAVGSKLQSIVLYGSVARGDNVKDSDVDIALFVKRGLDWSEKSAMFAHFSDMALSYDMCFSPIDIEQKKYDEWVDILPFYRNIKQDGVILWAQT